MDKQLVDFIHRCAHEQADPDQVLRMLEQEDDVGELYAETLTDMVSNMVDAISGNVYQMPILSPHVCDIIVGRTKGYTFKPNDEEGVEYRIEEAVLSEVDPELHHDLIHELMPVLSAYCLLINSTPITEVVSLQVAKYTPEATAGTGWHHDKESDFTCTISLNPGEFEGGGTGIRVDPCSAIDVSPLEQGHGLMFNGRSVQHRGLPVTKGERLLLVCWCSTK